MRNCIATCCALTSIAALPHLADAQSGDREGHVMTPPPEHWVIPEAPVLTPEKALETFVLEDEFRMELVAAEPMVHDPVALAFDGNGRLWVAEMMGYMPDIDGKKESETYGRISVLEDTDGDGRVDRHTVFLEQYLLPRALALVNADHSLLFADNEQLYEAEIRIDDQGDISAGEVVVVDETYAVGGNPEHKSNGLVYGLDNWFYNAKSDLRYRKVNGQWIKERTEDRGQWGIKQDNYGRLLTNTNSNLITVEEIPPGLTLRNSAYQFRTGVRSRIEDQRVWPSRITPGVNRGYMDGVLSEEGFLLKPTAVSGLVLYRGDQFPPAYRGNLFIPEPAGNLVKRAVVTEREDGFRTVESATQGTEFLTSTDERSRIVDAFTAPDGSLYLLDFYRGIIQHQVYMTSYLRAQVEERELYEPLGMGRIWRITHAEGKGLVPAPQMQNEEAAALVAHLEHANGWWRDTAQRLLVERGDLAAVPALKTLVIESADHLARIHAVWTLEGLGQLDEETLGLALADSHPRVVAETIRASESLANSAGAEAVFTRLSEKTGHESILVRRQLAASLGLFGERAIPHLVALVTAGSSDRLTGDLAVSGLSGLELPLFRALPESHDLRTPLIDAIVRRNDREAVIELLALLKKPGEVKAFASGVVAMRRTAEARVLVTRLGYSGTTGDIRRAIAEGMIAGGKDKRFRPMPVKELAGLDELASLEGVKSEQVAAIGKLFDIGSGEEIAFIKTDAEREQYERGEYHYQRLCTGCHQPHGNGQQYLAPPLAGSEWVLGSVNRLIATVMDGVEGPIEVMGKLYTAPEIQPLMPGLRFNPEVDDEQLAAILTYVRNAWGNAATPVSAKTVTAYRESMEPRAPWPASELVKME